MAVQPKGALATRAVMNISKAEEVRKETELMMKPHANWEEYLMPGPISIALLGELACIAAGQGDFAINLAPPEGGYKYMRYPDSFQASLMQVSNSGWHAFSIAHKNMDGIRLLSMSVPEQIKMVMKTLFQDDLTLIDALLPGQLSSLKLIANECSSLAKAVDNKFNDVICLIEELLEVCMSSKSQYEQGLTQTKHALEDLKLRKAAAEEAQAKAEEYYKEVKNRVTDTFDDYRKAIDSIPTGWSSVILDFTSTVRETLMVPITCMTSLLILTSFNGNKLLSPIKSRSEEEFESRDDFIAMNNICALSGQMAVLVDGLKTVVDDEGNIDMDLLYNKKNNEIKTVWSKKKSQQLLEKIKKERNCSLKNEAVKICKDIIEISNMLTERVESGNINQKELIKKMNTLSTDIVVFDSRSKSCNRTSPFCPVVPNMAKSQAKAEEYYMEVKNRMTDMFDDSRKEVDNIPTGWSNVILDFTSTVREILTVPIANLTSLLSFKKNKLPSPIDSRSEEEFESRDDFIAMNNICALSAQMVVLVDSLKTVVDDKGNINMDVLYNKKNNEIKTIWIKNKSQQLLEKINKERKCSLKNLAMKICNYIIEISNILTERAESGNINQKELIKKMDTLLDDIEVFDSRSKSCSRTSPFGPMAPNMAKSQKNVQEDSSLSSAVKNCLLKTEQTKEILKMSQEEYQKSFDNLKEQNKDLLDVLSEMRKCEIKEIDFEKAQNMLIKGLDAMGRMKEQWEKMVRFFQMISNLIDSCLSKRLTEFVKLAEDLPQIPNYSHQDFVIDMIYKQAFNASNIAHLVHMISETYTDVSSKYLMDNVGSLSRLISMDPSVPQFQMERIKLADGCDNARKAIEDLVVKQKKEFENNIHARVAKINSELKAVLPEMPEAERKAIEQNVHKGMREITEDEADQFM